MVKRALFATSVFALGAISAAAQAVHPIQTTQTISSVQTGSSAQTVPAGTTLHCRLIQTLSTRVNYPGDTFTALVSEPLAVNGRTVIPVGTTLTGRVASVKRPGRIKGVGEMRLIAQNLALPDGRDLPLDAVLEGAKGANAGQIAAPAGSAGPEGTIKGPHSRVKTIGETVGFAGGGALVGLIFAHPLVGMAVGGATGFVDHMRRRGDDLTLVKGAQIDYQLTRECGPLIVPSGPADPAGAAI